jgi:hypothetical protein
MGRGRAKAKQTKVARALKYGGPQTDFDRLQAELGTSDGSDHFAESADEADDEEETDDPYAKYYVEDDDEGDEAVAR